MPSPIAFDDLKLLERIDELGSRGSDQVTIARELGISVPTLRYRAQRLGLRLAPSCRVMDIRSDRLLRELIDAGELTPDEPLEAEVVA